MEVPITFPELRSLNRKAGAIDESLAVLTIYAGDIAEHLGTIAALLKRMAPRIKPGPLTLIVTSEVDNMLQFKIVLPELKDADVVLRRLAVKVGDGEFVVREFAPDTLEADGYEGPQDAAVEVSLVDVDDAGNVSQPSTLSATLVDTIPPSTPDAPQLVVTGETSDAPAEPAPE